MTHLSNRLLYWAPRVLSLALILLLSVFALDVFEGHLGIWQTVLALFLHLLPSLVLLVALVLAWRWEWIGAAVFAGAGVLYIASLVPRSTVPAATRAEWAAFLALPAFVIAALFLVDWMHRAELHPQR